MLKKRKLHRNIRKKFRSSFHSYKLNTRHCPPKSSFVVSFMSHFAEVYLNLANFSKFWAYRLPANPPTPSQKHDLEFMHRTLHGGGGGRLLAFNLYGFRLVAPTLIPGWLPEHHLYQRKKDLLSWLSWPSARITSQKWPDSVTASGGGGLHWAKTWLGLYI